MIEYDKDKNGTISFPEVNIDILIWKKYEHFCLEQSILEISSDLYELLDS